MTRVCMRVYIYDWLCLVTSLLFTSHTPIQIHTHTHTNIIISIHTHSTEPFTRKQWNNSGLAAIFENCLYHIHTLIYTLLYTQRSF